MSFSKSARLFCPLAVVVAVLTGCGSGSSDPTGNTAVTTQDQAAWQRLTSDAETARKKGDMKAAENAYLAAMVEAEKLGADNPANPEAIANAANFYYVQGDGARADQLYRKSLAMKEKLNGTENIDLVKDLVGLAKVSVAQKKYGDACTFYSRAVAILRTANQPIPDDLSTDFAKAQKTFDAEMAKSKS
jgi:tetratricopeptide (TPR) repeat protein